MFSVINYISVSLVQNWERHNLEVVYHHRWIETLEYQMLCPVVVVQQRTCLVTAQRRTHLVAAVQRWTHLVAAVHRWVRLVADLVKLMVWDLLF